MGQYTNFIVILVAIFALCLTLSILKKSRVLTTVLLVVFSIIAAVSLFAFKSLVDVAHNMNETASYSEIEMSVVVPSNSSVNDVSDLTSVQAPTDADGSNINELLWGNVSRPRNPICRCINCRRSRWASEECIPYHF